MEPNRNAKLLERIHELEAENARLRKETPSHPSGAETPGAETEGARGRPGYKSRSRAWTLLAATLIVIGSVLAPLAVVASWAKVELTDSDRFVAAYAPLAHDPAVRAYVTDQTFGIIDERIDIPQLTSDVIDGVTSLGTGPRATEALNALKGPAAQGIQSLIRSKVADFVSSAAFATVWEQTLRISHQQLLAALQNDPSAAVSLGPDGSIGIQLAPIIDQVKTFLVDQGITFASQIPSVNRTIIVAQSDALPTIQLAYGLAVGAGIWLPWIALLFLTAGVLVARRKSIALIWAAVALALGMVVVLAGLAIGNVVFITTVRPDVLPSDLASVLLDTVLAGMRDIAIAVLVLAIVVAVVGWYAGPFKTPQALRGLFTSGAAHLRQFGEGRGLTTGRVGDWIYRQRTLLRVGIAVVAAAIVLLVRPLTPALTLWTLVLAAVVVGILEFVQRPPVAVPAEAVAIPAEADEGIPVEVPVRDSGTRDRGTRDSGTRDSDTD